MAAATSPILDRLTQTLFPTRKEYLSFAEAAAETSLSERTLRRYHRQGRLQVQRVGSRRIILRQSLDELLNSLS